VKSRIIGILCVLVALSGCSRKPAGDVTQISAPFVQGSLPYEDPTSGLWQQAPEFPATLLRQDVTEPMLTEPGVDLVKVRALHNGEWIVFRLEWSDPTQDLIPLAGHSSDAAAIQFPSMPAFFAASTTFGSNGSKTISLMPSTNFSSGSFAISCILSAS